MARPAHLAAILTAVVLAVCVGAAVAQETAARVQRRPIQSVTSDAGMVVSDTPLASAIGAEVLERGGNAVDAAVAVAFALAVTWPEAGNIAGGGFMMVAIPGAGPGTGEVVCVDYRETAPAAATAAMFKENRSRFWHGQVACRGRWRGWRWRTSGGGGCRGPS